MSLTLEDLVAQFGVNNINKECSDEDILAFGDFCDPWEEVGRFLGLSPPDISAIAEDHRTASLKRLGVLQKWKSKFAFKATYSVLITALLKCKKADQACQVCQILAQKEQTGEHTDSTLTVPKVEMMAQTAIQQAALPMKATSKLDLVIDAENRSSKHLGLIADSMYEWEGAVADELELTPADVAAINKKYPKELKLQAREALEKWKQVNGSTATYRNLIRVFEKAGYKGYAATVRNIISQPGPNAASSSAEGAHGGSVASPVQLVKPVADDGSCDVPQEPVHHLKAVSTLDSMPGGHMIEQAAKPPQSFPTKVRDNHLKLIKWIEGGETKRFYLMEVIENKWRDIGQVAGLSLAQLESIATEHREKPTNCCRAVLGKWLENPPDDYPITWDGLIGLLEDCKLTQVVKELRNVLSKANLS